MHVHVQYYILYIHTVYIHSYRYIYLYIDIWYSCIDIWYLYIDIIYLYIDIWYIHMILYCTMYMYLVLLLPWLGVTRDFEFEEELRGQVVLTLDRDVKTGLTSDHDNKTWKLMRISPGPTLCRPELQAFRIAISSCFMLFWWYLRQSYLGNRTNIAVTCKALSFERLWRC